MDYDLLLLFQVPFLSSGKKAPGPVDFRTVSWQYLGIYLPT